MKTVKNIALTWVLPLVVCAVIGFAILKFVIFFPRVTGSSMADTYHDGEVVACVRPLFYGTLKRGDVVIVESDRGQLIKRIIALPGETVQIKDGAIFVNGEALSEEFEAAPIEDAGIASEEITLEEGEFFVLGDNRNHSVDSRIIGLFESRYITGKMIHSRDIVPVSE